MLKFYKKTGIFIELCTDAIVCFEMWARASGYRKSAGMDVRSSLLKGAT